MLLSIDCVKHWLADYCTIAPGRLLGMQCLPLLSVLHLFFSDMDSVLLCPILAGQYPLDD